MVTAGMGKSINRLGNFTEVVGVGRQQGLVAFAATQFSLQFVRRHPIGGVAVRTDQVQGVHGQSAFKGILA